LGSGAITNNATLVFNRVGALSVTGAIGGTGTVTHSGSGTTTLSGTNTYSGTTTVSAGSLTVSGTLGGGSYSNTISIATSANFTIGNSVSQTLSGVITPVAPRSTAARWRSALVAHWLTAPRLASPSTTVAR
jgi:autotransporter-associated beta strand protein